MLDLDCGLAAGLNSWLAGLVVTRVFPEAHSTGFSPRHGSCLLLLLLSLYYISGPASIGLSSLPMDLEISKLILGRNRSLQTSDSI